MGKLGLVLSSAALLGAVACGQGGTGRERVGALEQRFASSEAVLLDFEFDGRLVADSADVGEVTRLIEQQLIYSVGQLNGQRSVGRHERLVLSAIVATLNAAGRFDITYHAKLPVAWAGGATPSSYTLILPASVSAADQLRFTEKYGTNCVHPDGGDLNAGDRVDVGRMFLFYLPQREGCSIDPKDVVTMNATVTKSADNSVGKYPEYHRIWDDRAFDVVALFGMEFEDGRANDFGVFAYDDFILKADAYLRSLQPDNTMRKLLPDASDGRRHVRLEATLPDGRQVHIDAMLVVPRLETEKAPFDTWYDARTPNADLILYSGHAAHGKNVRSLMTRGAFKPGKYVIWVSNGCDTFAYVDETLATRRAALNPDDPSGTKYMDVVSNVLGGWFRTGDETSMTFIQDITAAGAAGATPKTYPEIFSQIDREQIIVVTGEEDNEFPLAPAATPPPAAPGTPGSGGSGGTGGPGTSPTQPGPAQPGSDGTPASTPAADDDGSGGCSVGPRGRGIDRGASALASLVALGLLVARRLRRGAQRLG